MAKVSDADAVLYHCPGDGELCWQEMGDGGGVRRTDAVMSMRDHKVWGWPLKRRHFYGGRFISNPLADPQRPRWLKTIHVTHYTNRQRGRQIARAHYLKLI